MSNEELQDVVQSDKYEQAIFCLDGEFMDNNKKLKEMSDDELRALIFDNSKECQIKKAAARILEKRNNNGTPGKEYRVC